MEETPSGTPVGVDDPYEHAGRCDHLTGDGRCRYALDGRGGDEFVAGRRAAEYACVAADGDAKDCPHYRSTADGRVCRRCGLANVRMAHDDVRPLVEEHHLSYADGETSHEISVSLCRWCHARVHGSWARVDDDAEPVPEAIAARETRRGRELAETGFASAAERRACEDKD